MFERKDWKDSKFDCRVRISKEDLEFIKKVKGKKTIAGKLSEIINLYGLARLSNKKKKQDN